MRQVQPENEVKIAVDSGERSDHHFQICRVAIRPRAPEEREGWLNISYSLSKKKALVLSNFILKLGLKVLLI